MLKEMMHNRITHNKKALKFLFLSLFSLGGLIYLIVFFPPTLTLQIAQLALPVFYILFPILFLFLFSLVTYFFRSSKHGLLLATFVNIYLIFRLNNLTHLFFLVLLFALFLILELLFARKKAD